MLLIGRRRTSIPAATGSASAKMILMMVVKHFYKRSACSADCKPVQRENRNENISNGLNISTNISIGNQFTNPHNRTKQSYSLQLC